MSLGFLLNSKQKFSVEQQEPHLLKAHLALQKEQSEISFHSPRDMD
jgi:hypothetical protein